MARTLHHEKRHLEDLAVFGGSPTFENPLHVGCPSIGNRSRLIERIHSALDRKYLTNEGLMVKEFEHQLCALLKTKHCITTCNGTAALQIAIKALGLKGEVILPSMTFIATAHALNWLGIKPVFCDIERDSYNLDPLCVESLITPRTTAILPVHLWGRPCNIEALAELSHRYNIRLLFDSAHALGSSYKRRMLGNFGDAEIFSFHATKFLNTFEGGAIATNNDSLAHKIRLMKNFGFLDTDKVECVGINGKMSEISAAMGLTGLESFDEFVSINRLNYELYLQELADLPGVTVMGYDETESCNFQFIVLEINEGVVKISRNQLMNILRAENVLARRYFYPGCHRSKPYLSWNHTTPNSLLHTENVLHRVLTLPTGQPITSEHIHTICSIIRFVVLHGDEIGARISRKPSKLWFKHNMVNQSVPIPTPSGRTPHAFPRDTSKLEVNLFTIGDASSISTWSNLPYFFSKSLSNNGVKVNKINLIPSEYFSYKLYVFLLGKVNRMKNVLLNKEDKYTFTRDKLTCYFVNKKLKKELSKYSQSSFNIFLTYSFSSFRHCPIPVIHYCDDTYEHFLETRGKKPSEKDAYFIETEKENLQNSYFIFNTDKECSDFLRDRYKLDRVSQLRGGLNLEPQKIHKEVEFLRTKSKAKNILFIGSNAYWRGVDIAIKAFKVFNRKHFNSFKLYIVGISRDQLDDLDENVHCYKYLNKQDRREADIYFNLLRSAKMIIAPMRSGPFPAAVVEAAHMYTPAVIRQMPGDDFVVDGYNGILLDELNPEEWARKMENLVQNEHLWGRLARNAHQASNKYSWDKTVNKLIDQLGFCA